MKYAERCPNCGGYWPVHAHRTRGGRQYVTVYGRTLRVYWPTVSYPHWNWIGVRLRTFAVCPHPWHRHRRTSYAFPVREAAEPATVRTLPDPPPDRRKQKAAKHRAAQSKGRR